MKLSNRSPEEIQKILGDAWLNIVVDERTLFNPILNIPPAAADHPHLYYTWLMSRPEYFSFICDQIFNVKIFPIQSVILAEMWNRRFPMLVMNRGGGKALNPDELVKIKQGWKKLKDLKIGDKVYASNGKLYPVTAKTGLLKDLKFYKITFDDGREIECCEDHLWKVFRDQSEFFDDYEVLTTKEILESGYKFYFPINSTLLYERMNDYNSFAVFNKKRLYYNSIEDAQKFIDKYRAFGYKVKVYHKFNKVFLFITLDRYNTIKKFEYIGLKDGMCITVDSPDKTYLTKDYIVTHNTFMLALYSMLRMLLLPGRKVIVAGAGFRQSKMVWEYCCQIWNNSPILRNALDNSDGPRGGTDSTYFHIGDSKATFVPVGCLDKDTLITTDNGIKKLIDLDKNLSNIYGDKKFRKIGFFHKNGVSPVIRITTKSGYSYIGTYTHKMKVSINKKLEWVETQDLKIGDTIPIDTSQRWFSKCENFINPSEGYEFGQLIIKKHSIKEIPDNILCCSKDFMRSLISAMFDAKATIFNKKKISLFVGRPLLAKQLQYILLHFGIASRIKTSTLIIEHRHIESFYHNIGFKKNIKKHSILQSLISTKPYVHHDIFFDKVSNIEYLEDQETFDVHIPEENIYCANGFFSHNSGETIRGLRCVSKDTIIQTQNGLMTIENYLKNPCQLINEFGQLETPSKIHETPLTDVYEVLTASGLKIKCSSIHQLKTENGWKLAKELTDDDILMVDINNYFPDKILNYRNTVLDRNYASTIGMKLSNEVIDDIPDEILMSPEPVIKSFFFGFFSGDSILYKKNHSDRKLKCFVKISKKAIQKMQILLLKFKIQCTVVGNKLIIKDSNIQRIFLEFKPKNSEIYFDKFFSNRGSRKTKSTRTTKVKSVKLLDKQEVLYDFTMPESHSFIGNGLVQHNSNDTLADEFKCVDKNTLVLTNHGIERISECYNRDDLKLINIQKSFESPTDRIKTPLTDVYHIICEYGYDFKCSNKHRVYTTNGWKLAKDLTNEDELVFKNYYKSPNKKRKISNLFYRSGRILIDELDIPQDLRNLGMDSYDKIPSFVLEGGKNEIMEFIEGISINAIHSMATAKLFFKSKQLADEVQFLLRCLGILSNKEEFKNGWQLSYGNIKNCKSLKVKSVTLLPEKDELYDFELPLTHSFIGNGFIQHNSHNQEIFESVISGFGSVSSSPQEKVNQQAKKDLSKYLGVEVEIEDSGIMPNQIVISGTAYYYFNHFAQYWNRWKSIIYSRGDKEKLNAIFPNGVDDGFDWTHYSVMRIPYQLLPRGYLDSANISRSKATLNKNLFQQEFETIFTKDSDGFFKASEIEACVANTRNNIIKSDGQILFMPKLSGDMNKKYYMGIDTASQIDNFAVVILEVHNDHRRIVYCWSTNNEDYKEKKKNNLTQDSSFLKFCNTKIRSLLKRFNIERISIDSQGGGRTFYESLHDTSYLQPGEEMIWEIIEFNKVKDSDGEQGLHIVELVNFAQAQYMTDANHGLKKDIENRNLLFPDFNPAIYSAFENTGGYYEEIDNCMNDIDELKKELTMIVVTVTVNGRERFDTPEIKTSGLTKGRLKKDRYSALIMANMAARTDYHVINDYTNTSIETMINRSKDYDQPGYIGPSWLTKKLGSLYD